MNIESLRKSVRPVVTYIVAGTFALSFSYLVWKFSNQAIAEKVIDQFGVLVALIIGFWFGSRQPKTPGGTS